MRLNGFGLKSMASTKPKGLLRLFLRAPAYLYRWGCGRLLGNRFLLLIHVGRRTGAHHQAVLEVMEYREEGPEFVVISGFGRNADWLLNIQAKSDPKVVVGSQRFTAAFRLLGKEEAMKVVRNYEHRNRFMALVVRYVLSRLLGWQYSGSEVDLRRLVAQLPLLAFRPRIDNR